ncbi:MAG: hypothetical protein LBH35_02390 [Treponema sp.]|nr:hypothetical protein [Treponema sp.]
MIKRISGIIITGLLLFSCENRKMGMTISGNQESAYYDAVEENGIKTIHVFVALCDNKYQNIARVPAALGNGRSPNTNLYWGALYGIRTYFKNSNEWELLATIKGNNVILERIIFRHVQENYYLIADAYNGRYIKQCIQDFLNSSSGNKKEALQFGGITLGTGGSASTLVYIGHDGLMDFQLSETFVNTDNKKRDVIILACYSKCYFSPHLQEANVNPLLWTSNLMAPEAYTLYDALTGYINGETNEDIRERAAAAYANYQKCSVNAAKGLLVTDW